MMIPGKVETNLRCFKDLKIVNWTLVPCDELLENDKQCRLLDPIN